MEKIKIERQWSDPFINSLNLNDIFKKTSEIIPLLKQKYESLAPSIFSEVESSLKKAKNNFKNRKISLVLVGSTCSGKTTLINALLNAILFFSNKKWMEILPSREIENTSSYAFLKGIPANSPDFEKNRIYVQINDESPRKISDKERLVDQISDLKVYFEKMEKKNQEIFYNLKINGKIQGDLPKIYIYFPDFNDSIQIIDTPGISTESFQNELHKIVESEVCLFIYVKNLDNPEVNKENVMQFLNITQKFFTNGNYQVWIVLTKEDKFVNDYKPKEEDEPEHIQQKTESKEKNFKYFLQMTEKEIIENNLKINKIYSISTLLAFRPRSSLCSTIQESIKRLLDDIIDFKRYHGDYFVKLIYLDRIKSILKALNTKLNQEIKISSDIIQEIKMNAESILDDYSNKVREFLKKPEFIQLENFKKNDNGSYSSCVNLIERAKRRLKKEMYIVKGQYERRIIEKIAPDVHKLILEKDLRKIFIESFGIFEAKILGLIKNPSLLSFLLGLDSDMITEQASNLGSVLADIIYNPGSNFRDLGVKDLNITELTTNLFTPGYREVFYAYYIVKFLGVEKYITINPHNLQVDDILSWFLHNMQDNRQRIIESTGKIFGNFLKEKVIEKLENAREMNQELFEILILINKITTESINFNKEFFQDNYSTIYQKMDQTITFQDPSLQKFLEDYKLDALTEKNH